MASVNGDEDAGDKDQTLKMKLITIVIGGSATLLPFSPYDEVFFKFYFSISEHYYFDQLWRIPLLAEHKNKVNSAWSIRERCKSKQPVFEIVY